MAVKYLAGDRLIGTAAERTALTTTAFPNTSWKELGRYTLTGTEDTINVGSGTQSGTDGLGTGSFAAKDNLMIIAHLLPTSDIEARLQFNGDNSSGNENYASRYSYNGGDSTTNETDADSAKFGHYANPSGEFIVSTIRNTTGREKYINTHSVFYQGSNLYREESVAKWTESAQIVNVQIPNVQSAGSYLTGSSVVVLGYDDDEADTGTNFWQKIASGTVSGGSITTGDFTAKKYMFVTTHLNASSNASGSLQFNTDTGGNYKSTFSEDGGSEGNWNLTGGMPFGRACSSNSPSFATTFILNPAGIEKFTISHDSTNKAGTAVGDAPKGQETVGRWYKSSDSQITNIKIVDGQGIGGTPWTSGSNVIVWGSD